MKQGPDVVEADLDLIDLAEQLADLVPDWTTLADDLLEPPLGGVEPAAGQVRLRLVVGGDRFEGIPRGHPGEGAKRGVGVASRVTRRPPASNRPRRPTRWRAPPGRSAVDAPHPAGRERSRAGPAAARRGPSRH